MNQKYLAGLSSDMDSKEDIVYFEATPENIAAFLFQHQYAQLSAIGTVDEKTFLTARMGFIDTCPDQQYLSQEILPVYSKVQMEMIPAPRLKTVSKELAFREPCLMPDWNYLRWDGYSDHKYQAVLSGEGLLSLEWDGKKLPLELQVRSYYNNGGLALLLKDWSNGEPEAWEDLTTNIGSVKKNCAFININHLGKDILPWIEQNGLGTPTGRVQRSGFVEYPEYEFDAKRLAELDDYGYQTYAQRLEKIEQPKKMRGKER